jgi:hypothetical protein
MGDELARSRYAAGYRRPVLRDYGTIEALTHDLGMVSAANSPLAVVSPPIVPGGAGGGGGGGGAGGGGGGGPDGFGAAGGLGAGGGGGGDGGELPFTGWLVAALAVLGSAMAAAGSWLRRTTRR